jgi:hypothetical protein
MKILFRQPKSKDADRIHQISKEFYKGYETTKKVLEGWIRDLSKQFIVVEVDNKIEGCVFWEYLDEIKAIPYFHKSKDHNSPKGKYAYVSEIVISDKYKNKGMMWLLYGATEISLKKDCQGIIWLTGAPELIHKMSHEETEHTILKIGGFKFIKKAKNWESAPGRFTDSHNIYFKKLP